MGLQGKLTARICRLTCEGDAMRDDDAAILEARATGRSVERIARGRPTRSSRDKMRAFWTPRWAAVGNRQSWASRATRARLQLAAGEETIKILRRPAV